VSEKLPGVFSNAVPRSRGVRLCLWYGLALIALALDYAAGPFIQFPIAFTVPVVLAAWFDGRVHALVLAIGLPAVRLGFVLGVWSVPWGPMEAVANAAIRIGVLGALALLTARVAAHERKITQRMEVLEKILPICAHCKKIREQDGSWQRLERYLKVHEDLSFSHGVCPDCLAEHYPESAGERPAPRG